MLIGGRGWNTTNSHYRLFSLRFYFFPRFSCDSFLCGFMWRVCEEREKALVSIVLPKSSAEQATSVRERKGKQLTATIFFGP
jgi:hypothetical protein